MSLSGEGSRIRASEVSTRAHFQGCYRSVGVKNMNYCLEEQSGQWEHTATCDHTVISPFSHAAGGRSWNPLGLAYKMVAVKAR